MGRHHLSVAARLPGFEIVGVADAFPAALTALAEKGYPTYTDYRKLLDEKKPTAVVIAAPNDKHASIALDCIERGIAVLVEKPISDSMEDALKVCAASEKAGVPVLVGHHRRHNPIMKRAAQHIQEGNIGSVIASVALWLRRKPDEYFDTPWKLEEASGGGILLINTIHEFDCIRMLCGEIDSIQCLSSNKTRGLNVEDTAVINIRFANGALGTMTVSDATVGPWCWEMTSQEDPRFATTNEYSFLVCGSTGSLAVPSLEYWTNEPNAGRAAAFTRQKLYYKPAESMAEQMKHFGRVSRGEEKPVVSALEGAKSLAAVIACKRSVREGRVVTTKELLG